MSDFSGFEIPTIAENSAYISGGTSAGFAIAGSTVVYYVNRVWHIANAAFVRWTTTNAPDPTGAQYPGPGTFGVATFATAEIESIA